jgi:hypothetical protein
MKTKDDRHLTFAKYIVDGMSQSEAYRLVYPNSRRWAADSVHNKASALARNEQVKARIEELRKSITKEYVWTKQHSLAVLATIARSKTAKNNEKIAAVKELNVMYGHNAPSKIDHTSSDGTMSPNKDLSKEELEESLKKYGIKVDK